MLIIEKSKNGGRYLLKKIRTWLSSNKYNALIVAHDDAYQNEILTPDKEKLAYLTSFTGSAGMAIITQKQSVLFVDGRYVAQAKRQTKFEVKHVPRQTTVSTWLERYLKKGHVAVYNPWHHTVAQIDKWAEVCAKIGATLKPIRFDWLNKLWQDKPLPPQVHVFDYPILYAGQTTRQKITPIKKVLKENKVDGFIVANVASISWLLNKRSDAIPYSPLYLDRCYISADGKVKQLTREVIDGLKGKVVGIDKVETPIKIKQMLIETGASVCFMPNPLLLGQARKNKTEIAGMRQAGILDSIALCRFLCQIEKCPDKGSEISILHQLEVFRKENPLYVSNSFAPISAVGKNGAFPHYAPTEAQARKLKGASLYLLDTGAQYWCGTTDMTRTIALSKPTKLMKKRYTQVLKGHIALAKIYFTKETSGSDLDVLARQFLWQDGVDYDHGTGHGVGTFLNVHETLPSISKYAHQPFVPNMVVTNEPGFYLKNKFGIRIENMMTVQSYKKERLCFEMLTFVPFCDELILSQELSCEEKVWLSAYYQKIMQKIYPHVDAQTQKWLEKKSVKWTSKNL